MSPYIKQERRSELSSPTNPGELNYQLTRRVIQYIHIKGESYQTYNDVLGVLTAIQLEMYRKRIASYEDDKEQENGPVW